MKTAIVSAIAASTLTAGFIMPGFVGTFLCAIGGIFCLLAAIVATGPSVK